MPYELKCPEDFFICQRCGNCCFGFGGTRLSNKDIDNIAAYLEIPPERVVANYCQHAGKTLQLAQKKDGYCIFWDRLCTIHPVKPRMCKTWPFIENLLIEPDNWQIMASICAGINPDVPTDQLKACVRKQLNELDKTDNPTCVDEENGPS